jgi:hypothetical protein
MLLTIEEVYMQKTFNFFYAFLLALLGFGITLMAEEITLTTYYPAPYGAYNELSVSQQEKAVSEPKTSALTVSSTDITNTEPLISASTKLNGMLLDSEDATDSRYILNIRSGGSLTSKFYVRADGNVGIGTAAPATVLDVNGTTNSTDYSVGGEPGADRTFQVLGGDAITKYTITVKKGIITSVTTP